MTILFFSKFQGYKRIVSEIWKLSRNVQNKMKSKSKGLLISFSSPQPKKPQQISKTLDFYAKIQLSSLHVSLNQCFWTFQLYSWCYGIFMTWIYLKHTFKKKSTQHFLFTLIFNTTLLLLETKNFNNLQRIFTKLSKLLLTARYHVFSTSLRAVMT